MLGYGNYEIEKGNFDINSLTGNKTKTDGQKNPILLPSLS